MDRLRKTERFILVALWIGALINYGIVLTKGFSLELPDYVGLTGLIAVSLLAFVKPELVTIGLIGLLLLGVFNIVSLVYLFVFVKSFGLNGPFASGIQLYSILLLGFLIIKRPYETIDIIHQLVLPDEDILERRYRSKVDCFKTRFRRLSQNQITERLNRDITDEARTALVELQQEFGASSSPVLQ